MKLENLKSFMALKRYMNFSKAAENLYMTQSALSKQIDALEKELGIALFERSHSETYLTPAGEHMSIYVEAIINEYEHMCLFAKRYQNNQQKLRIASFYGMAQYCITDLIVSFEQNKVDFHVESRECEHISMIELLENNQTDIVIGYQELWPKMFDYQCVPLQREKLVLIVDHHHQLAKHDIVKLEEAKGEHFCFPKEDSLLFKFFKDSCSKAGFVPNLTQSDVRLDTIRNYIRAGMRVTLQPSVCAKNFFFAPEFRIIALHDAPTLTLSIIANKTKLSEIGNQFFDFAQLFYNDANA